MRKKPIVENMMVNMFEAHAEKIISDLLEVVIKQIEPVMQLHNLEGDAAFFVCDSNSDIFLSEKIMEVMEHAQEAFKKKSSELVFVQACGCEPYLKSKNLRLKIVAHKGLYTIQKIRHFEEVVGEDVILIHRMLKNNFKSNEYWLITEQFYEALTAEKN